MKTYVFTMIANTRIIGTYKSLLRNTEEARDEMLLSRADLPVTTELRFSHAIDSTEAGGTA